MGRMRITAVTAGAVVLGAFGTGVMPAGAQTVPDLPPGLAAGQACSAVFAPGAFGGFLPTHKAAPGEPISVEIGWEAKDFSSEDVELIGCLSQGGKLVDSAATRVKGVDNGGDHRLAFTVPTEAQPGTNVCQRAAVVGTGSDGTPNLFKTPAVCYTVTAAGSSSSETKRGSSDIKATEVVPAPGTTEVAGPPPFVAGKTETRPASAAAPEPKPAPVAAPAAALAPADTAAAPEATLARTGSAERLLFLSAGLLLCLGGLAAMFGARRTAVRN